MRFPEDVPVLTDGVVTLRAHTDADIEPTYEMCQDPQMQRWTTIPVPYEREHAVNFLTRLIPNGWRDGGMWAWAIEYDGQFAGTIDLRDGEGGTGELEPQGNWWKVPELEGGGIRLRAFRATDAKRVAEACNDERTQFWLAGMPSPYQVTDAEAFIEGRLENLATGDGVSWAIADAESGEVLGCVSVFDMNHRIDKTVGEIGYWSHPETRGRGVMSTAVGLVIDHAFKPTEQGGLGRRRLTLFAAEGNTAYAYVAQVNGFTYFGTQRSAGPRRDGEYSDILGFDLLITDRARG